MWLLLIYIPSGPYFLHDSFVNFVQNIQPCYVRVIFRNCIDFANTLTKYVSQYFRMHLVKVFAICITFQEVTFCSWNTELLIKQFGACSLFFFKKSYKHEEISIFKQTCVQKKMCSDLFVTSWMTNFVLVLFPVET